MIYQDIMFNQIIHLSVIYCSSDKQMTEQVILYYASQTNLQPWDLMWNFGLKLILYSYTGASWGV